MQAKHKSEVALAKQQLDLAKEDKARLTEQLRVANEKLRQDKASNSTKEVENLKRQLDTERGQTINFKQVETALKEMSRKCAKLEAELEKTLSPFAAQQLEREMQELRKQVSGNGKATTSKVDPLLGNLPCCDELLAKVRSQVLNHVFAAFDVDGNGYVECDELMLLGAARQKLGHRQRDWTEAKNKELLRS